MTRKIFAVILSVLLVFFACACEKKETAETKQETETVRQTAQVTETAGTSTEETAPTETYDEAVFEHKDMEFILSLLAGGGMVYMETTEDMIENNGGSFGDVEKKQMGDGGYEFTFEPNVNEHMPLIKRLDEYEGAEPFGGQAVFMRFKTSTAGIYISFLGDNDFGVYFGNEGEPLVFTYTENNPFQFEGNLKLEADKWYNILMAMESDGTFNCIIYLDDESDNPTAATVELGETQSGLGYKNQSWQFEIATHEEGAVTVEHFDVYTYTEFKR